MHRGDKTTKMDKLFKMTSVDNELKTTRSLLLIQSFWARKMVVVGSGRWGVFLAKNTQVQWQK